MPSPAASQPTRLSPRVDFRRDSRPISSAALTCALIALPLLVVSVPLTGEGPDRDPALFVLQWAIILLISVRLGLLVYAGRPKWLSIVFWCFSYVWIGVANLAQIQTGRNPLLTSIPDQLALIQLIVILVGLVSFDLAQAASGHQTSSVTLQQPAVSISVKRVVCLSGVSVAVSPVLFLSLGGFDVLFKNREAANAQLTDSGLYSEGSHAAGGIIISLSNAVPFVALFSLAAVLSSSPKLRRKFEIWLLLALVLAINVLLNNPISNPRYWFLTVVLSFVFFFLGRRPRPPILSVAVAFIAASLVLFPLLNVFRYDVYQKQSGLPEVFLDNTDFGAVTDIGLIVRYVDRHGHTDGKQLLGAALFAVPRAIWQDKAANTYALIAEDINFPYPNLDSPLWAEGYVDFGLAGVILLLGGLGFLAGRLEKEYLHRRCPSNSKIALISLLLPAMAAYAPIVLRGSLLQAMARLAVMVVCLLLVCERRKNTSTR